MAFSAVLIVNEEDVHQSSTLRKTDIGKYAIIINGAWHMFVDKVAADNCYATLYRHRDLYPKEET